MLHEIESLVVRGQYEEAFSAAKDRAQKHLEKRERTDAALALSHAARILCTLNDPIKAVSLSQQARELAQRGTSLPAEGVAEAARSLARLRMGQFERSRAALDKAIDLMREARESYAGLGRLIVAEILLAQEEFGEARDFAHEVLTIARTTGTPLLIPQAQLLLGLCDEREENFDSALKHLYEAKVSCKEELFRGLEWQIQGARANIYRKQNNDSEAEECRSEATNKIQTIAAWLNAESRRQFLQSPAVRSALGEAIPEAGALRTPVQVTPRPSLDSTHGEEESTFGRYRPIFNVIKKINAEQDLQKLLTMILDTMIEFCNAARGTIVIFEKDRFKTEISRSQLRKNLSSGEMGLSKTVLEQVRAEGEKFLTSDAREDSFFKGVESAHDQGLLSILCLPLRIKTRLIGAVYLDNPSVLSAFGKHEEEVADVLTDHAAIAVENTMLHSRAIHDGLTELFNHSHFEKRLEMEINRARRHGRSCGLILVDLDDFKQINDTFGHQTGNDVLQATAKMLTDSLRSIDTVARVQEEEHSAVLARYGGDEFEIILPETNPEGVRKVGERLLKAADKKIKAANQEWVVRFSAGSASFPEDASDHRSLILKADEAMYAAKRMGKSRFLAYHDIKKEVKN